MITKQQTYALQILRHLGRSPDGSYVKSKDIQGIEDIPSSFCSATIEHLAAHGFVETQRGRGGGVRLARNVDEISIADVLLSFGAFAFDRGAGGEISGIMVRAENLMIDYFRNLSIAMLMEDGNE